MKLFKYEGYNLTISEEALTLKPFKVLWNRDKSAHKETATQELGYIYFMEDPRSDYASIIDRTERAIQVKKGEGLKDSWKPDAKVLEAQEFYASFKTDSALLLEDLRKGVAVLRSGMVNQEELEDIDIEKKPRVLNDFATVLSKLNKLVKELDETEKQIAKEIASSDKVRGSNEKAMFEDDY